MSLTGFHGLSSRTQKSSAFPSGRYLEINSWMWQVNGLNLLVDPLFGILDFGVPILIQGKKRVSELEMK